MKGNKDERTFLLRFNLNRAADRKIWEWLHEESAARACSMNALLIEGLRKLMAQETDEKPLDVHALAEELCWEMRAQGLFLSSAGESPESITEAEEMLSADVLDFANSF